MDDRRADAATELKHWRELAGVVGEVAERVLRGTSRTVSADSALRNSDGLGPASGVAVLAAALENLHSAWVHTDRDREVLAERMEHTATALLGNRSPEALKAYVVALDGLPRTRAAGSDVVRVDAMLPLGLAVQTMQEDADNAEQRLAGAPNKFEGRARSEPLPKPGRRIGPSAREAGRSPLR